MFNYNDKKPPTINQDLIASLLGADWKKDPWLAKMPKSEMYTYFNHYNKLTLLIKINAVRKH